MTRWQELCGAAVVVGCSFQELDIRLRANSEAGADAPGGTSGEDAAQTPPADAAARDATTRADACLMETASAPRCPAAAILHADAMRPTFRVVHLRITAPVSLTSAILQNTVNDALHRGGFLWGVSFDLTANMLRTGALNRAAVTYGAVGLGLFDGAFRYHAGDAPSPGGAANRWDPATTTAIASGDRVTSGTLMGAVRLPIFDAAGDLLMEFPLENATVRNVSLTGDRRCVGAGVVYNGRFNECTSNWHTADAVMTPFGTVEAVVSVAAARSVWIPALNQSLCALLAGSNCDAPQTTWARQPDAMASGQPGYRFFAEFAAVSARIP